MPTARSATLILACLAGSACSDFATAPDRTPTELRVTPDAVLLTEGESAAFQVEVLDQHGEPFDAIPSWAPPFWSTTAPELIELDGRGNARGLAGGESTALVEVAGLTVEAVVRTNPAELDLEVPFVYVTQSVQRTTGEVPLIADRPGLLRVYVQGGGVNFFRPLVRATFHNGGEIVHTADLSLENIGIPETRDEGDLTLSYDADIPGSVLQPGVTVSVEVDPEGIVPATAESVLRVPATGGLALDVRDVTTFRLRMVPVHQAMNGRNSRLNTSYARQVTRLTNDIFPFGEFDLDVRDPYVTEQRLDTDAGWYNLIDEIRLLRWDDGSPRYYYGGFDRPPGTNIGGLGYVGYPVAIGMEDRPDVIAHEVGHTLGLPHAPCGNVSNGDPAYPYRNGFVGQYGYDRSSRRLLQPFESYDLMSYCDPIWISDYNYQKVLAYRDTSEFDVESAALAQSTSTAAAPATPAGSGSAGEGPMLLVRGGVFDGRLRLEPALEWNGPAALPTRDGRYTLEGLDAAGSVLFTLSLEPAELDHGGNSQFLVALPAERAQVDRLARLRLAGPEGVVERGRSGAAFATVPEVRVERVAARGAGVPQAHVGSWDPAAFPMAVVRDRETGLIRAMARSGTITIPGDDSDRFEVLLSDGLATRAARMVQQ